jgi:hypothetical protein
MMTPVQAKSGNQLKRSFVAIESGNEDDRPRQKLMRKMNCHRQSVFTMVPVEVVADDGRLPRRIYDCAGSFSPCQQTDAPLYDVSFDTNLRTQIELTPFRITPEASVLDLSKASREGTIPVRQCVLNGSVLLGAEKLEFERDMALDCDIPSRSSEDALRQRHSTLLPVGISLSERRSCLMEHQRRKSVWAAIAALLMVMYLGYPSVGSNPPLDPNSVYVSGGGFSGFWFSIGRLQSVQNPATKSYYCYSAGCLAVVAALSNSTLELMSDLSFGVQRRWQTGETKHHGVVTDFLDKFVVTPNVQALLRDEELLAKIHIITAVKNGWYGLKSAIRSPTGADDLHKMLLQTTWIPFATGEQVWEVNGSPDGEHHMDGIFSSHDHPVCAHHVGLPWNWDLRVNALNVNLGAGKVAKFWKEGLVYGL